MLADYWCEHGDVERGTYVHAACEGLVHQHALVAEHGPRWFAPLWDHGFRPARLALDRGFVRPLVLEPDSALARDPELFRISPIVYFLGEHLRARAVTRTRAATRMTAAGQRLPVIVRQTIPDGEGLPSLDRELDLLGRCTSPHVIQVLGLAQDTRGLALVLPALAPLRRVATHREAAAIGAELAAAIGEAHRCGIVHAAISRSHLWEGPDGAVLDGFANARCDLPRLLAYVERGDVGDRSEVRLLAPEQSRGDAPTDAVDVWAVAMLVTELALGHSPVHATNDMDALIQIRDLQFERVDPATPLGAALARALVREPARRPTARVFGEALALVAADR